MTTQPNASDARASARPKAPGSVTLGLTVVLLLVVALTGLTSRQAPPPTVAQFAPQAVQQIKEAPPDQSSRFGEGEGEGLDPDSEEAAPGPGSGATVVEEPTAPASEPEGVPVTRRCVGNPPRQIEDSQSPPCVAFWQGDNGGATWKGVTATTIRVAVPTTPKADPGGELQALEDFFNDRFEFYGRKLELFNPEVSNSDAPEAQRNDAAKVDSLGAFASAGYSYNYYYAAELARLQIVSATSEPYYSEAQLATLAPHVWQYEMSVDKQFANKGAWICSRLAGKLATATNDPIFQNTERRFGIVHYRTFREVEVDLTPLISRLEGCGSPPAIIIDNASVANSYDPAEAQNTALQLQQASVTSVVCTCNFLQLANLLKGSTSQGYFPEWLTGTYFFNDSDYAMHQFVADPVHNDHMIGVTFQPRELRPENTPATWAVVEGRGSPDTPAAHGTSAMYTRRSIYHELLLLASGIQMAGPTLTPMTFEAGLQAAAFPNPPDPSNQGTVGFRGDHSMTDDGAEYYWHSGAVSPYPDMAGRGAFCYVESGTRRTLDTWPRTDMPYGQLPCDSRDQ